ncbi:hypothetical protein RSA46_13745 [Pseudomonas oryzihabitans]|nr:hypothetical protein SB9_21645 [Pseudomonas psychrotolerans]KTT34820.1 hypothetical protein NS201_01305 [Pseudomonas psychrotolerans]KTT35705.1 hypothetical protein SB5_22535 [Pseudomonas psychrotolerans]KTT44031.1 hypothetical protein RSA46_13745 [Pseudomonas psychrotolerans]KTT78116.1 hypothetical protein SB18R_03770 [Pseudomonas psychrotolerans]
MLNLIGAIFEAASFGWDIHRELKNGERGWRWVRNYPRIAWWLALVLDITFVAILLFVSVLLALA